MKALLKYIVIGVLLFYAYNVFKHPGGRASMQAHEIYDMASSHLMDAIGAVLQRRG